MSPVKGISPVSGKEAEQIKWRGKPEARRQRRGRHPDKWDTYVNQIEAILDDPDGSGVAQVSFEPYTPFSSSDREAFLGSTRLRSRLSARGRSVSMKTEPGEGETIVVFIRNSRS